MSSLLLKNGQQISPTAARPQMHSNTSAATVDRSCHDFRLWSPGFETHPKISNLGNTSRTPIGEMAPCELLSGPEPSYQREAHSPYLWHCSWNCIAPLAKKVLEMVPAPKHFMYICAICNMAYIASDIVELSNSFVYFPPCTISHRQKLQSKKLLRCLWRELERGFQQGRCKWQR